MDFSDKLNAIMKEFGLTVEEVADACDVSKPTIERWMNGKNKPYRALRPLVFRKLNELIKTK